jgi:hypothetical protein
MKNLLKIAACLIFVFLLTGVSFAKSERKSNALSSKTYINCVLLSRCQTARQTAAALSSSANDNCLAYGVTSEQCSTANRNAASARENAVYVCDVFPDGVAELQEAPVAVYTPKENKITGKLKTFSLR